MLLLGFLTLFACGGEQAGGGLASRDQIRTTEGLMNEFARMELRRSPELATRLGLSEELAGYEYSSSLDDHSQAGYERTRLMRLEMLERMSGLAPIRAAERRDLQITLETARSALQNTVRMSAFGHGQTSLGFARPYAADQLSGAYTDLPELLTNRRTIRRREEAFAYLARLSQMAGAIDDERRRLIADAASGVIPPDFILQRMATQTHDWLDIPSEAHPLVEAFGAIPNSSDGVTADERAMLTRRAQTLLDQALVPAYESFHTTLLELAEDAPSTPGIWAINGGEAYYAAVLQFYSGTQQSPEALHQTGLRLVSDLSTELDTALIAAGMIEGPVGARLAELSALPGQIYDNTPEGHDALLASLSDRAADANVRMREIIDNPPRTPVTVLRVPQLLQANSPGGYYAAPAADGSTPGFFFINLRDTAEWPAFTLPTLLYHETIPGHHLESTLTAQRSRLATIRQLIWLASYGEGWALYAEDLADELGLYDDDPLGRIGYLQSVLFRASRLVADTGLHHKKWSREEAVTYLVDTTGQSRTAMETEIERYTVWPAQSVSYMVGREFIHQLRTRAERVLSSRFTLQGFHNAVLAAGPRPRHLVEADVDAWINDTLPLQP